MTKLIRRRSYFVKLEMTNYTPTKVVSFFGSFVNTTVTKFADEIDTVHIFKLEDGRKCRVDAKYITELKEAK